VNFVGFIIMKYQFCSGITVVSDGVQVLFASSVVSSASYGLYVITMCRIKAGALVLE